MSIVYTLQVEYHPTSTLLYHQASFYNTVKRYYWSSKMNELRD